MEPFTARYVTLPVENIDTDQIIPARFLKTTEKKGLGESAFYDWRYDSDGHPKPDFVLNRPEAQGASVLIAGHNFGCGSSREHAPWALLGVGFRAVVSSGFAEIFRNNAMKNGLLPVQVEPAVLQRLIQQPGEVTIDLANQTIMATNGISTTFPIDSFAKHCLLNGIDQLGFLVALEQRIIEFERVHDHTLTRMQ
jgi:3-isopropylmalate/(R)-2-methylmalate dehydratase small subunit